jgi:BioD-like phosphotransacetylase family protein
MKLPVLGGYLMRVSLILVAIVLASCAPQTQYIRADGRYASPQSIEGALAECGSESNDSLCMVEKGYFNVPAEQAEAKRVELAAIAEANEQAKVAKAKEKERQATLATQAAQRARKQALDEKKRKRTVNNSTSGTSIWSNPPTFSPVAPVRR